MSVGSFTAERGEAKELVNVWLTVPSRDDELRTILRNAWGAPRKRKELSETVYTWFNPHNGEVMTVTVMTEGREFGTRETGVSGHALYSAWYGRANAPPPRPPPGTPAP